MPQPESVTLMRYIVGLGGSCLTLSVFVEPVNEAEKRPSAAVEMKDEAVPPSEIVKPE